MIQKLFMQLSTHSLQENGTVFKILHLTDTHYDPHYVEGSIANCQEPLCCRLYSTPPANTTTPIQLAGKWGSYEKCDAPKILIDNALKNMAETHKDIDFIIWTGDIPPHDIWNQTREYNLDVLKATLQMVYEAFPNTPIFPALGNHEGVPAGTFPPPWMRSKEHAIDWLYKEISKDWSKWLPDGAKPTVMQGGFFSVLLRPGFRLISLNTNYCHSMSWWLMVNSTDPAKELQWLIYELQLAEAAKEKVHIIGHIPPGQTDCLKTWSRNFYSIVDRFEGTIAAMYFAHTHYDEFAVFYDETELSKRLFYWR